ncbi:hypothetical protein TRIP_C20023 [Candidatus Zixiibacteriota bacterium]|nr:hypothetical protein TRIP_C20023 [candidate division Zixibacteria bacterium]
MKKHTVLLVDDEPNVLKSLKRLMIDTDYQILTAESGEEGLKILDRENIHLVISDYRMPGMNGVEFLKKVKDRFPETMRLILSGFADATAIVDAINDGQVYKFMPKPWNDQELMTTVKRALEQLDLQQENTKLYQELQERNKALEELTAGLESAIGQRTKDLESKNRALAIAHKILDLLPVGVLGIDMNFTVAYMNESLSNFIDISRIYPGSDASAFLDESILSIIRAALNDENQQVGCHDAGSNIICTPLKNKAGVIVTFVGVSDLGVLKWPNES